MPVPARWLMCASLRAGPGAFLCARRSSPSTCLPTLPSAVPACRSSCVCCGNGGRASASWAWQVRGQRRGCPRLWHHQTAWLPTWPCPAQGNYRAGWAPGVICASRPRVSSPGLSPSPWTEAAPCPQAAPCTAPWVPACGTRWALSCRSCACAAEAWTPTTAMPCSACSPGPARCSAATSSSSGASDPACPLGPPINAAATPGAWFPES